MLLAISLATTSGSSSLAQQSCMGGMAMGPQGMSAMHTIPPPEQLPVPIRMSGIGNGHIAITASPEAQQWFDQGLNLMHDFWDFESTKAFEQAVRVDPQCAMCFWGLAKVEGFRGGPEKVYGTRALAEAVRLKGHVSEAEKLYIEAAQAESKDKKDNHKGEVAKLRKLVKKYPNDLQARIFLATEVEDGYDDNGEPKPGEQEGIAILEAVLRDTPNDSAANHYWIHAIEPGNHPERAIPSAKLLASLAPTSGHMVHMPGHIFYRVGDYADADHWFAASTQADERYMRDQHVSPDDDWNYVHNMMYGIANLMEQGRLEDANALSDRLAGARGELSATLYIWSARDQISRLSRRLPVALRIGDWSAVLAMLDQVSLADTDKTRNLRFLAAQLRDLATGMKALDQGDTAKAEAASSHMDAALEAVRKQAKQARQPKSDAAKDTTPPMIPINPDAEAEGLVRALSVASLELRASVLAGKGKLDEAKQLFATAQKDEKALGYHEPPFYIRPVAETEAVVLIRAHDYTDAATAYRAALVERPASGFELFGLARVKELSGDAAGARAGYAAFLNAWPHGDSNLPEIVHAREVTGKTALASRQ